VRLFEAAACGTPIISESSRAELGELLRLAAAGWCDAAPIPAMLGREAEGDRHVEGGERLHLRSNQSSAPGRKLSAQDRPVRRWRTPSRFIQATASSSR
jgi:hypothetical protein